MLHASNRPGILSIPSLFSLAIALSPALFFGAAPIPNYVVNTTADDATGTATNCTSSPEGVCTLRDALAAACTVANSNITFDPTIFLASNSIAANTIELIYRPLYIGIRTNIIGPTSGNGATLTNLVTIDGSGLETIDDLTRIIFYVGAAKYEGKLKSEPGYIKITNLNLINAETAIYNNATMTVSGSLFSNNSNVSAGAAIFNQGSITVAGSTFSGNSAQQGGAIYNIGALTVSDCTFTGNFTTGYLNDAGGAIFSYPSPFNGFNSSISVGYSTFSGNSSDVGGAIALYGTGTITNSTVSGNNAAISGGGIFIQDDLLNIADSIVEGNTAGDAGSYPDIGTPSSYLPVIDLGGNLLNTSASLTVVNPNLAPLGNYGGSLQTLLPLPGSAAICGGFASDIPAGVTTDERGYPNKNTTYPGYSSSTPCVDSGAVQTNYALAVTTQPPATATYEAVIAPAPVVALNESGDLAGAATGNVNMTDSAGLLSGTTSGKLSSGTARFTNLVPSSTVADDLFTASLGLNPSLNIAAQASQGVTITSPTPVSATMQSPIPGTTTIVGKRNIRFQWSRGANVTRYELLIGTNGAGSYNILATAPLTTASYTQPILPADGVTLYVRLGSLINGAWQTEDYQYAESGTSAATLTPSSGILSSTSQLFTWSNGNEATYYQLMVTSNGPGSPILFHSGLTLETSATVSIPASGATVYAWLYQLINGAWQRSTYMFAAPGTRIAATLLPASGTLSTSQLFNWSNGNEARLYRLQVGTKGSGSTDLLATGITANTSVMVNIPANGKPVYAVLYQFVNGVWLRTNYRFTEP